MNVIYLILGGLSLVLGIIGAFLPILPTVPFILLSAFFFSKGHPPAYLWLKTHSPFAQSLTDWESEGAISRASKRKAAMMIIIGFAIGIYVAPTMDYQWLKILLLLIGISVLTFIQTRPEPR